MRTVFRAQANEARLVLVLCWAFLVLAVVSTWLQFVSGQSAEQLAVAVLGTVAAALFARLQLASCRGGSALAAPWLPVLIMAMCVAPIAWGILSPLMVIAWAPAFVQRDGRQVVVGTVLLVGFLIWVFPRSGLEELGGFADLFLELMMFTIILVAATRLAVLLDDLQFTREVLARRRVDLERERVGRDLHDIMGRTLVAASLRNQAALQALGDRNPAVTQCLERLHEAIGRGQAQLRALTSGPVIARLEDELAAGRMLCERVQIDLAVDLRVPPPAAQEALLALVVREGITNVLKHSRATTCRIEIDRSDDQTVVTISNDGSLPIAEHEVELVDSRVGKAVAAAGGVTDPPRRVAGTYTAVVRVPLEKAGLE